MYYKQTVDGIKLVILNLDGGLLDLNRLRYNYFSHTCKQHNQQVSKEVFTSNLGNVNTMYSFSPIQDIIDNKKINDSIERDLYEYAKIKKSIKKEGVDELLQFFRQKEIKIAVISTHETKKAIKYLQLTHIYKYVDFVIGGDEDLLPLPDVAPLKAICQNMHVDPNNVLVIANFTNLVIAANELLMNIIYVPDLAPANSFIELNTYRIAKNNFEAINTILIAKYDTVEIYSPLLGMSRNMDLATLKKVYENLLIEFSDDEKLTSLVQQTYHFFLTELNDQETREEILKPVHERKAKIAEDLAEIQKRNSFYFEDGTISNLPVTKIKENISEEISKDGFNEELEGTTDLLIEELKIEVIPQTIIKPVVLEPVVQPISNNLVPYDNPVENLLEITQEAEKLNVLMDKINGSPETFEQGALKQGALNDPQVLPDKKEEEEPAGLWNNFLDFGYVCITSLIIVFVSIIGYLLVRDFVNAKGIFPETIKGSIDFYINAVRSLYAIIFNGLHSVLGFIPSYNSLMKGNGFFSNLGVQVVMFTIFNVILFYLAKFIFKLIRGARNGKN